MYKKTLLKQNALIRVDPLKKVQKINDIDATLIEEQIVYCDYSAKEHDVLNAILYILQTRLLTPGSLPIMVDNNTEYHELTFQVSEIKKLANIKDNTGGTFRDIINSIQSRIHRYNQRLIANESGKQIKHGLDFAVIGPVQWVSYGNENYVKLPIHKTFITLAHVDYSIKYGNYTKLKSSDMQVITHITNKTAKRLYEYINMRSGTVAKLSEQDLRTICGEQPAFANYKIKINEAIKRLSSIVEVKITLWQSKGEYKYCELEIKR